MFVLSVLIFVDDNYYSVHIRIPLMKTNFGEIIDEVFFLLYLPTITTVLINYIIFMSTLFYYGKYLEKTGFVNILKVYNFLFVITNQFQLADVTVLFMQYRRVSYFLILKNFITVVWITVTLSLTNFRKCLINAQFLKPNIGSDISLNSMARDNQSRLFRSISVRLSVTSGIFLIPYYFF